MGESIVQFAGIFCVRMLMHFRPAGRNRGIRSPRVRPVGGNESTPEDVLPVLSSCETAYGTIVEDIYGFYKEPDEPPLPPEVADEEAPPFIGFDDGEECQPEEEPQPDEEPKRKVKGIVKRYTLTNPAGMSAQVINYGATVISVRVPDRDGIEEDVVLGFDNMQGYTCKENQYFGGLIGRVSGPIEDATFSIGKREIYLKSNRGDHHFNGGLRGFDKVVWDSYIYRGKVVMSHVSRDREEGYPGSLLVQVMFSLTRNNRLVVEINATTSKPTPLSITPHIYFNLAGHGTGPEGLKEHCIMVNADRFVVADTESGLPTGEVANVGGSYYDLRVPRPLERVLDRVPGGGYDHTFCLTKGPTTNTPGLTFAIRLVHPPTGRYLEVWTDNPGLHIYTGDRLPDPDVPLVPPEQKPLLGRDVFKLADLDEYDGGYTEEIVKGWPEGGDWPRPPSEPEEEHVFPTYRESELDGEEAYPQGVEFDLADGEGYEATEGSGREQPALGEEEDFERAKEIEGKMGCSYRKHGAICLLPQEYPNAVNIKSFPSPIAYPGRGYRRTIVYSFGVVGRPKRRKTARSVLARIAGDGGQPAEEQVQPENN